MNVRLWLATIFIRGRSQTRWLIAIDRAVSEALATLMDGDGIAEPIAHGGPGEYRRAMAARHAIMVKELLAAKGIEAGTRDGREVLFRAGMELGKEVRERLRLSDDITELMAAARLMYRVLGIDFSVTMEGGKGRMTVQRCSLAQNYTPATCEVISAMDEGVVSGLNPRLRMTFVRKNCPEPPVCTAELILEGSE